MMNEHTEKQNAVQQKTKPAFGKNYDVAERTLKLKVFFLFLAPFSLLGITLYHAFKIPWYYALIAAIIATTFVLSLLHIIGKTMDHMSGRRSTSTTREQLSGDVDRIKYLIRNKKYDEAFQIVESVLNQDPDYPEVLYFKGGILWDGFGLTTEAKETMLRVMALTSPEDSLYVSALDYRKKI